MAYHCVSFLSNRYIYIHIHKMHSYIYIYIICVYIYIVIHPRGRRLPDGHMRGVGMFTFLACAHMVDATQVFGVGMGSACSLEFWVLASVR